MVNVGHCNVQENVYHDDHNDALSDAQSSDIERVGLLPNNDPVHPLLQRIEHPYLNGMYTNF
jgi:hypothetical protein